MVGLSISFIEEGIREARVVMALQIQNDIINAKQHNATIIYWPHLILFFPIQEEPKCWPILSHSKVIAWPTG